MTRTLTLQELLAVEDDPRLLEFRCPDTGIPIWTTIRASVLRFLMSDLVLCASLVEERQGASFRTNRIGAVWAMARAVTHNVRAEATVRGELLITTGSAGLQLRDGKWFNRLTDYFGAQRPDETVILEDLYKWRWRWPRHHRQVLFHTPTYLAGQVAGRLGADASHSAAARVLVKAVAARASKLFGWNMSDGRSAFLIRLAASEAAAMPHLARKYRRLFERLGTRIAIKEMGCYGRSAVFNATARRMGITVAEHQHGLISGGHDAYNFASTILKSAEYRCTLPQYLLTYGDWWGEQINAPLTCITIGNPHRSEQLKRFSRPDTQRNDVLVLGDGYQTDVYFALCGALATRLPQKRVVFRPHPLERARVLASSSQPGIQRGGAVHVDVNSDIYESFASAIAIVSEASTGLFEAVGLVERIFALDTPRGRFSMPRHPFESCTGADDMAACLSDRTASPLGSAEIARIWAPDWRSNYRAFLEDRHRIEPVPQAV